MSESEWMWEITFTLRAGAGEPEALDIYEMVEIHPDVTGAVLVERLVEPEGEEDDAR